MSIPVRIRGNVVANVDIVGIDIPEGNDGRARQAYLVVERTDNQKRYSFRIGAPNELDEGPDPGTGYDIPVVQP
jgi:hypothetical protein